MSRRASHLNEHGSGSGSLTRVYFGPAATAAVSSPNILSTLQGLGPGAGDLHSDDNEMTGRGTSTASTPNASSRPPRASMQGGDSNEMAGVRRSAWGGQWATETPETQIGGSSLPTRQPLVSVPLSTETPDDVDISSSSSSSSVPASAGVDSHSHSQSGSQDRDQPPSDDAPNFISDMPHTLTAPAQNIESLPVVNATNAAAAAGPDASAPSLGSSGWSTVDEEKEKEEAHTKDHDEIVAATDVENDENSAGQLDAAPNDDNNAGNGHDDSIEDREEDQDELETPNPMVAVASVTSSEALLIEPREVLSGMDASLTPSSSAGPDSHNDDDDDEKGEGADRAQAHTHEEAPADAPHEDPDEGESSSDSSVSALGGSADMHNPDDMAHVLPPVDSRPIGEPEEAGRAKDTTGHTGRGLESSTKATSAFLSAISASSSSCLSSRVLELGYAAEADDADDAVVQEAESDEDQPGEDAVEPAQEQQQHVEGDGSATGASSDSPRVPTEATKDSRAESPGPPVTNDETMTPKSTAPNFQSAMGSVNEETAEGEALAVQEPSSEQNPESVKEDSPRLPETLQPLSSGPTTPSRDITSTENLHQEIAEWLAMGASRSIGFPMPFVMHTGFGGSQSDTRNFLAPPTAPSEEMIQMLRSGSQGSQPRGATDSTSRAPLSLSTGSSTKPPLPTARPAPAVPQPPSRGLWATPSHVPHTVVPNSTPTNDKAATAAVAGYERPLPAPVGFHNVELYTVIMYQLYHKMAMEHDESCLYRILRQFEPAGGDVGQRLVQLRCCLDGFENRDRSMRELFGEHAIIPVRPTPPRPDAILTLEEALRFAQYLVELTEYETAAYGAWNEVEMEGDASRTSRVTSTTTLNPAAAQAMLEQMGALEQGDADEEEYGGAVGERMTTPPKPPTAPQPRTSPPRASNGALGSWKLTQGSLASRSTGSYTRGTRALTQSVDTGSSLSCVDDQRVGSQLVTPLSVTMNPGPTSVRPPKTRRIPLSGCVLSPPSTMSTSQLSYNNSYNSNNNNNNNSHTQPSQFSACAGNDKCIVWIQQATPLLQRAFEELSDGEPTVSIVWFLRSLKECHLSVDLEPFHGLKIDRQLNGTLTRADFDWIIQAGLQVCGETEPIFGPHFDRVPDAAGAMRSASHHSNSLENSLVNADLDKTGNSCDSLTAPTKRGAVATSAPAPPPMMRSRHNSASRLPVGPHTDTPLQSYLNSLASSPDTSRDGVHASRNDVEYPMMQSNSATAALFRIVREAVLYRTRRESSRESTPHNVTSAPSSDKRGKPPRGENRDAAPPLMRYLDAPNAALSASCARGTGIARGRARQDHQRKLSPLRPVSANSGRGRGRGRGRTGARVTSQPATPARPSSGNLDSRTVHRNGLHQPPPPPPHKHQRTSPAPPTRSSTAHTNTRRRQRSRSASRRLVSHVTPSPMQRSPTPHQTTPARQGAGKRSPSSANRGVVAAAAAAGATPSHLRPRPPSASKRQTRAIPHARLSNGHARPSSGRSSQRSSSRLTVRAASDGPVLPDSPSQRRRPSLSQPVLSMDWWLSFFAVPPPPPLPNANGQSAAGVLMSFPAGAATAAVRASNRGAAAQGDFRAVYTSPSSEAREAGRIHRRDEMAANHALRERDKAEASHDEEEEQWHQQQQHHERQLRRRQRHEQQRQQDWERQHQQQHHERQEQEQEVQQRPQRNGAREERTPAKPQQPRKPSRPRRIAAEKHTSEPAQRVTNEHTDNEGGLAITNDNSEMFNLMGFMLRRRLQIIDDIQELLQIRESVTTQTDQQAIDINIEAHHEVLQEAEAHIHYVMEHIRSNGSPEAVAMATMDAERAPSRETETSRAVTKPASPQGSPTDPVTIERRAAAASSPHNSSSSTSSNTNNNNVVNNYLMVDRADLPAVLRDAVNGTASPLAVATQLATGEAQAVRIPTPLKPSSDSSSRDNSSGNQMSSDPSLNTPPTYGEQLFDDAPPQFLRHGRSSTTMGSDIAGTTTVSVSSPQSPLAQTKAGSGQIASLSPLQSRLTGVNGSPVSLSALNGSAGGSSGHKSTDTQRAGAVTFSSGSAASSGLLNLMERHKLNAASQSSGSVSNSLSRAYATANHTPSSHTNGSGVSDLSPSHFQYRSPITTSPIEIFRVGDAHDLKRRSQSPRHALSSQTNSQHIPSAITGYGGSHNTPTGLAGYGSGSQNTPFRSATGVSLGSRRDWLWAASLNSQSRGMSAMTSSLPISRLLADHMNGGSVAWSSPGDGNMSVPLNAIPESSYSGFDISLQDEFEDLTKSHR